MERYKEEFVDFMMEAGVLTFGDFVTKSGRNTPFFVNTGNYQTGSQLCRLGGYYARAIHDHFGEGFSVLFGPAYKGIPLSVAASMALSREYGQEVRYCSNRKEAKDHGDTGVLLGAKLKAGDKVLMIEDVTTAGTSIRETLPLIQSFGAEVVGLVISVDRMERGTGTKSALAQIQEDFGFPVASIVNMAEVKEYLGAKAALSQELLAAIDDYYRLWGAQE